MKLPFVSRKKYDNLRKKYDNFMSDYKELVYKLEQDTMQFRKGKTNIVNKKHIVLEHVQKSIFVERDCGLRLAKRVLLSKLEEIIGIGDQATILFEVKPLPVDIAEMFYPEELEGRRPDGQYVVKGKFVYRDEWVEEYNKNCFVLLCHVFVEDIKNEIPEYSDCLPYEES